MSDSVIFPSELTNATPIGEDRLLFSDTSDAGISKDCAISDLPISTDMQNALGDKVDKVSGKSLILDSEITRLGTIETGAEVNITENVNAGTNITVVRSGKDITISSIGGGGGSGNAGAFAYELQTATAGQTVFNLGFDYVLGNNLMVFLEGGKQVYTAHYNETDISTVTFLSGLDEGTKVEFVYMNKGLNWKGVYSGSTTYKVDDAVSYNGSSYICVLESTGNLPTNATYFGVLASRGEKGDKGDTGEQGIQGDKGIKGDKGDTGDTGPAGIGDMLKSENLSGLANYATTRTNLDVHSKSEVVTLIDNATVGLLDDRGSYDASVNTFPATGGSGTAGAIKKGDLWFISVGGTLGGQTVTVGDSVRALVDTPGQTAGNWNIIEVNINYVPENQANKVTDVDVNKTSNTFFATVKAIYDWATGLFYTKSEVNTLASNYYTKTALDGGQLDNRYYTESEINSLAGNYVTMATDEILTGRKHFSNNDTFFGDESKSYVDLGNLGTNQDIYLDAKSATYSDVNVHIRPKGTGQIYFDGNTNITGNISATNLSNTNTGDQTITPGSVTATAGQTVFTTTTYVVGSNKLIVFINGFLQEKTTHYTETSTTSITFGTGLDAGSIVTYRILS